MAAALALSASGVAEPRLITVADMRRFADIEQPAISPDGRRVAALVIRQRYEHADYESELVVIDAVSGSTQLLRRGHALGALRWSADGSRLGFLAAPQGSQRLQVFVHTERGDRQITHVPAGVIDYAWSSDGRRLAFTAPDEPVLRGNVRHELFDVGNNDYTLTASPQPVHLWVSGGAGGRVRRLTSGTWSLPVTDAGGIYTSQFSWAPDGKSIAYTALATPRSGDSDRSTLWEIDVRSGVRHKFSARERYEMAPQYAPASPRLIYYYPRDGDALGQTSVRLRDAKRDASLWPDFDRNVGGALWMPDGRSILICANDGAYTRAWLLGMHGTRRRLPLGRLSIACEAQNDGTFDSGIGASVARTGAIAFVAKDATHAAELYLMHPADAAPRRLTHVNDVLASFEVGAMREMRWKGSGGFDENGILTVPPRFDPRKRYPLVVLIHGGPVEASTLTFPWEFWPRAQVLAAHGYAVLQPNYRGSDNLGDAYERATRNDLCAGPGSDIIAGVDAVTALPYIDPARIALAGYSEGGLLTSWLIGHDHRWRAAISGAAPNDLIASYSLSVSNVQDAAFQGGRSPFSRAGASAYVRQSPLTYAAQVTTPTLIWSSTGDAVVPIPMSYTFYRALKDNGVPVRFVAFPGSGHGPDTPVNTADLTQLWLDWLDRYLAPASHSSAAGLPHAFSRGQSAHTLACALSGTRPAECGTSR